MNVAARLGCAIPTKKIGEETFVQIVTNEPLLECRVLASCIGPNREEAIRTAMAAAGVSELVEGPRPIEQRTLEIWHNREMDMPERVQQRWDQGTDLAKKATMISAEAGLRGSLTLCETAVDMLIGTIRDRH